MSQKHIPILSGLKLESRWVSAKTGAVISSLGTARNSFTYFPIQIEVKSNNAIYKVLLKVLPFLFPIVSLEVAEQANEEKLKPDMIDMIVKI